MSKCTHGVEDYGRKCASCHPELLPNESSSADLLTIVEDCMDRSFKIIQIMIAPNDATWQGLLLGLGDDGNVYSAGGCGWEPYFEGKLSRENKKDT